MKVSRFSEMRDVLWVSSKIRYMKINNEVNDTEKYVAPPRLPFRQGDGVSTRSFTAETSMIDIDVTLSQTVTDDHSSCHRHDRNNSGWLAL